MITAAGRRQRLPAALTSQYITTRAYAMLTKLFRVRIELIEKGRGGMPRRADAEI